MSLISTTELAALLGRPRLRLLDVRTDLTDPAEGRRRYDAGHIPGAVFVDLESDLTGTRGPGRHPLPRPEEFSATARRLGISPVDLVVAYDDAGGAWAARLWWMLQSLGHPRVKVLDGGITAWVEEGRPQSTAVPRIVPGDFTTVRDWRGVVARADVASANGAVIDARAAERYRGEHEPIDRVAGHIPGAVNRPYGDNLGPNGRFRPPPELLEIYKGLGPHPIVYCGSGVSACHDILAMKVAGLDDALLYEGSWSDWSNHQHAPVETGPG